MRIEYSSDQQTDLEERGLDEQFIESCKDEGIPFHEVAQAYNAAVAVHPDVEGPELRDAVGEALEAARTPPPAEKPAKKKK